MKGKNKGNLGECTNALFIGPQSTYTQTTEYTNTINLFAYYLVVVTSPSRKEKGLYLNIKLYYF
jgi:hypothetical protein